MLDAVSGWAGQRVGAWSGQWAERRKHLAHFGAVLRRTARRVHTDRIALVAAGCAFYTTLALFPGMSILLSAYGLLFNPKTVEPQLALLRDVLPPEAATLIAKRVQMLVSHHHGTLGVGLGVGAVVTFWSSMTGTKAMLSALNLAYDETERRGVVRFQLTGLGITIATFSAAVLALALLVALPQVLHIFGLSRPARGLVHTLSVVLLLLFVAVAVVGLYRLGPSRHPERTRRVVPGAVLATLLWLAASSLFQVYVNHLANFDATYGPLGAMAGVMLWFWVTIYVMLLGAELNSALEHTPDSA